MKRESEVAQWCLTLSDPMDYSLPGSSIHGIFQARVLERGAIAFSKSSLYSNSNRMLMLKTKSLKLNYLQLHLKKKTLKQNINYKNLGEKKEIILLH